MKTIYLPEAKPITSHKFIEIYGDYLNSILI